MVNLFVYGTLMSGQAAASKLSHCRCLGRYRLADYAMYRVTSQYPGINKKIGESVVGEVYEIPESLIDSLDYYEGPCYDRCEVSVSRGEETLTAIVYVYNRPLTKELMRETWDAKDTDYVWYAGYGSNLDANRFRCYIQGGVNPHNHIAEGGCATNRSMWIEEKVKRYPGKVYFANRSSRWNGCGVAFYEPTGGEFGNSAFMHLYKITRQQLHEIQWQEGMSPNWYGRLVCLDVMEDGCPVYTFTSETKQKENEPDDAYVDLMRNALIEIGADHEFAIDNYLAEMSEGLNRKIRERLQRQARERVTTYKDSSVTEVMYRSPVYAEHSRSVVPFRIVVEETTAGDYTEVVVKRLEKRVVEGKVFYDERILNMTRWKSK